MPLYRLLEGLAFDSGHRIKMGAIDTLRGVPQKTIEILLKKNRISVVVPPPLEILPGLEEVAEVLRPAGIETVTDLVDADLEELAKEVGTSEEDLEVAQEDAKRWVEFSARPD